MQENKSITIEIDLKDIKEKLQQIAVDKVVTSYFEATDITDYHKRATEKSKRIDDVISKVDWNKLPEEMQRGILSKFISKIIDRY